MGKILSGFVEQDLDEILAQIEGMLLENKELGGEGRCYAIC